jgi:hypothetical protein
MCKSRDTCPVAFSASCTHEKLSVVPLPCRRGAWKMHRPNILLANTDEGNVGGPR